MATLKRPLIDILAHPAVKALDVRLAAMAEQLIQPAGRSRTAEPPKQDGMGRPGKRDERLAFIDARTPGGQEPTSRTRRLACEQFGISDRQLRRDLEYRRRKRTK
jgi:hypothetical protein